MTVRAVEGAAGCGKTYRIMGMLREVLAENPPREGQRVLALTFYHGSRRRMLDKLRTVEGLASRVECTTIDAFSLRLIRRWRGLLGALAVQMPPESQFDEVCDAAGLLMEQAEVRDWTARSFPILLVDEGQDLSRERLRIIKALSEVTHTIIAADEFQCLVEALRPNPLVSWLVEVTDPEILTEIHRTNVSDLRKAASVLRNRLGPEKDGKKFKIFAAPTVPLASTFLANAIAWNARHGDVAIITPSRAGNYVNAVVARVCEVPCGKQLSGPYPIKWEGNDKAEAALLIRDLSLDLTASGTTTLAALQQLPSSGPVRQAIGWVQNQIHALGRTQFSKSEIEAIVQRYVTLRRQHGGVVYSRYIALTVQQAKNREFDGVVVLWPYEVGGDAEQKWRLLYNAVTRAKLWCNVIVQHKKLLTGPPFA